MTRLSTLLTIIAVPALADDFPMQPPRVTVHHDPSPGAAWYARVVVETASGCTTARPNTRRRTGRWRCNTGPRCPARLETLPARIGLAW
jgi:hypothetical protein